MTLNLTSFECYNLKVHISHDHSKLEEDFRWKLKYWALSYIIFSDFLCPKTVCPSNSPSGSFQKLHIPILYEKSEKNDVWYSSVLQFSSKIFLQLGVRKGLKDVSYLIIQIESGSGDLVRFNLNILISLVLEIFLSLH